MIRPRGQTGFASAKAKSKALHDVWPTAKTLSYVIDDPGWGLRQRMGHIQSRSGTTYRALASEDSVTYVEEVFNDYLTRGDLAHPGRSAGEVGPGDKVGVALLLQSAGCETVEVIYRFPTWWSPDQQVHADLALTDRHGLRRPDGVDCWDNKPLPGTIWRLGSLAED